MMTRNSQPAERCWSGEISPLCAKFVLSEGSRTTEREWVQYHADEITVTHVRRLDKLRSQYVCIIRCCSQPRRSQGIPEIFPRSHNVRTSEALRSHLAQMEPCPTRSYALMADIHSMLDVLGLRLEKTTNPRSRRCWCSCCEPARTSPTRRCDSLNLAGEW
jgi:hypothetical protein